MKLIQGNEACALGALDAGCTFFAGYPITPASEIMEWMSRELPKRGHTFIQMEDEIASLGAVIGSVWAGGKAMTATSGPGFSLMQEHVGYAAITETPCVIVNCQRGGPSTGLPTLPSQGDVMQSRWGSHGDRPAIVLTASSVLTAYEMTVTAFNLSERFRMPVVLLLDAVISHMRENVELPEMDVIERNKPSGEHEFKPFGGDAFSPFGVGERKVVTGLGHDERGLPQTTDGTASERILKNSFKRIEDNLDEIIRYDTYRTGDAEWLILAYGITSRPAKAAVQQLRKSDLKIGLLDLQTLWPFPEALVNELSQQVEGILVPELNMGQLITPVRAAVEGNASVHPLNRADGELFQPKDIMEKVVTMLKGNGQATMNMMNQKQQS